MTSVVQRLEIGQPTFSVEFFPPRGAEDEQILWRAIRNLEILDPAYVSVTYGAGGHNRDRTIRTTGRIANETTLVPMAHLTAVDHSVTELRNVLGWYAAVGVQNVLAIRGDPPGDVYGEWIPHPEGLRYAEELVTLVRELGDFCVGVAASPYGHPRSPDLESDTRYLVSKLNAGADFAIAQLFFAPEDFLRLRDRMEQAGCDKRLIPGILPLTTRKTLDKTAELSGAEIPDWLSRKLEPYADDPVGFRKAGMDVITETCTRLLDEGVDNLHFYTFNRSKATSELVDRLGLVPARA